MGIPKHDEHLAERGHLSAEAVLDASIVIGAIKLATNRERPYQGFGEGGFWPQGTYSSTVDGSFPSVYAAAKCILVHVIAL